VAGGTGRAPLHLALGDSLATGAWPGFPRPWLLEPGGARVLGVPASWFDHPDGAYPALVARACGARLVSLAGSAGTLPRLVGRDGRATPALRAALARRPDVVTLSAGANDVLAGLARRGGAARVLRLGGLLWRAPGGPALLPRLVDPADRDAALRVMAGRLDHLLALLAAPGRTVVATTYPVGDGAETTRRALVGPVNAAIRDVCAAHGARVADLERAFRGHGRRDPRAHRWISSVDGMHPTARGHRAIAGLVLAEIATAAAGPAG